MLQAEPVTTNIFISSRRLNLCQSTSFLYDIDSDYIDELYNNHIGVMLNVLRKYWS